MVNVILHAGLANKMFQFAFAKGLEKRNFKIQIDQKAFKPVWQFEDILLSEVFPNLGVSHSRGKLGSLVYNKNITGTLLRKTLSKTAGVEFIYETQFRYDDAIYNKISKNCFLYGLWQSEKYFLDCKDEVRKAFEFPPFLEKENICTADKMQGENSVAIHVRKGRDYKHLTEICPAEYYQKAIVYIRERIESPVFYVFTDNPEWVRKNIAGIDYLLCDWNPACGKTNYRDMQLMTYAKHNIIANSSFSWWGAWLNSNAKKIIIAPEKWFGDGSAYGNGEDLIPYSWLRL